MDDERVLLMQVRKLIIENTGESLAEAVATIDKMREDLRMHDCNDFADDCDCEECEELPDMRGVIECLEFGLPHIVEKYGESSMEAREARDIIESK